VATKTKEQAALLTISQAAAILGLHKDTLKRLASEGVIQPVTIPGLTWARFRRADLEALINGEERAP
jgi:excisionase family DNA binding protein